MVLAPHPDDEVIGCGINGIIKKEKSKIQIIYLSNGIPNKENVKNKILERKKEAIELNQNKNYNQPIFLI